MRIYAIVENLIRENGAFGISAYETFEGAWAAAKRIAEADCRDGIYRYVENEEYRRFDIYRVSDGMLVYQFWINTLELKK